jgi:hypothetical protein
LRYVVMAPNTISAMHKGASLDYGIVLEGEIELVLDLGETKLMRRSDACVQRGTNRAWRNVAPNGGWGRMVDVLVAAQGEGLEEELNGMPDVKGVFGWKARCSRLRSPKHFKNCQTRLLRKD